MFKEVVLSPYRRTGSRFATSEPYTIAFAYPSTGPVCIKGMMDEVNRYLDILPICHYRYTYWHKGQSRGGWRVNRANWLLTYTPGKVKGRYVRSLMYREDGKWIEIRKIRTVPKKFMQELKVVK